MLCTSSHVVALNINRFLTKKTNRFVGRYIECDLSQKTMHRTLSETYNFGLFSLVFKSVCTVYLENWFPRFMTWSFSLIRITRTNNKWHSIINSVSLLYSLAIYLVKKKFEAILFSCNILKFFLLQNAYPNWTKMIIFTHGTVQSIFELFSPRRLHVEMRSNWQFTSFSQEVYFYLLIHLGRELSFVFHINKVSNVCQLFRN